MRRGVRVGRERIARPPAASGPPGRVAAQALPHDDKDPQARPHEDLVERNFTAVGPDQL